MAILGVDTLTGCNSIPSFLGGSSDTPSNPTKTIFHNTNAPTSWVKDTTHNDKSLRIIGGVNGSSLTSGGVSPFTTIFGTSRSTSGSSSSEPINPNSGSILNYSPAGNFSSVTSTNDITASTQQATLSTAQMGLHWHPYSTGYWQNVSQDGATSNLTSYQKTGSQVTPIGQQFAPADTPHAGAGDQVTNTSGNNVPSNPFHAHPMSAPHYHPVSYITHTHLVTSDSHSHQFNVSGNFSIFYVDVIIATKS